MEASIGAVLLGVIGATSLATVGSIVSQARRGERADPKRPLRWLLTACLIGLVATISAAMAARWSSRAVLTIIPFAALTPLALAGSIGALHRKPPTDEL